MNLFDKKIHKYFLNYIFQSIFATVTLIIILYFENIFTSTAIVASLGATTFIIFAMPKYTTAQPRRVIGGHIVGILVGIFCFYIHLHLQRIIFSSSEILNIVIPAFSVGLAIFIMVITNTEHPPAAGTALGIMINGWTYSTLLVILFTTIILSLTRHLSKAWLKNLV